MSRVRHSSRNVVHVLAACRDCDWHEDDYLIAARKGTAHVRATGHTVQVEQGVVYSVRREEAAT